jgi:hypothetical protein
MFYASLVRAVQAGVGERANKRIESARVARPTRKAKRFCSRLSRGVSA